MTNYD